MSETPTSFKEYLRKLIAPLAVLGAVVAALFYIAGQQRASFVPLPVELKVIILILLTGIVAQVLAVLSATFGINLTQYRDQVAAALAGVVIVFIESYLALIPPAFDEIMVTVWHLVVLILGALGVVKILREHRAPGFRV